MDTKLAPEIRKDLADQFIKDPIGFKEFDTLHAKLDFEDLAAITKRIFDLNEGDPINKSEADIGMIGKLNRRAQKRKNDIFFKKIKEGQRNQLKVILAEGDSWFEFPIYLKDILDNLIHENPDFGVYSLAYGADWLSNIIYEGKYIEDFKIINPDVFLISGGGNDLVGGNRLALMVCLKDSNFYYQDKKEEINNTIKGYECTDAEKRRLLNGVSFLNKEFYGLVKTFHLQYMKIIIGINRNQKNQKKPIRIITHGYDYPIPSFDKGFGFNPIKSMKPLVKTFLGVGKWLKQPLLLAGITDENDQKDILFAMIYIFNEMLIEVGKNFENVFHIDCRNAVNPKKGWFDELHPESYEFKKIANVFARCINEEFDKQDGRVIKVQAVNP